MRAHFSLFGEHRLIGFAGEIPEPQQVPDTNEVKEQQKNMDTNEQVPHLNTLSDAMEKSQQNIDKGDAVLQLTQQQLDKIEQDAKHAVGEVEVTVTQNGKVVAQGTANLENPAAEAKAQAEFGPGYPAFAAKQGEMAANTPAPETKTASTDVSKEQPANAAPEQKETDPRLPEAQMHLANMVEFIRDGGQSARVRAVTEYQNLKNMLALDPAKAAALLDAMNIPADGILVHNNYQNQDYKIVREGDTFALRRIKKELGESKEQAVDIAQLDEGIEAAPVAQAPGQPEAAPSSQTKTMETDIAEAATDAGNGAGVISGADNIAPPPPPEAAKETSQEKVSDKPKTNLDDISERFQGVLKKMKSGDINERMAAFMEGFALIGEMIARLGDGTLTKNKEQIASTEKPEEQKEGSESKQEREQRIKKELSEMGTKEQPATVTEYVAKKEETIKGKTEQQATLQKTNDGLTAQKSSLQAELGALSKVDANATDPESKTALERKSQIETQLKDIDTQIAANQKSIDALKSDITSAQADIASIQNTKKEFDEGVKHIHKMIAEMKSRRMEIDPKLAQEFESDAETYFKSRILLDAETLTVRFSKEGYSDLMSADPKLAARAQAMKDTAPFFIVLEGESSQQATSAGTTVTESPVNQKEFLKGMNEIAGVKTEEKPTEEQTATVSEKNTAETSEAAAPQEQVSNTQADTTPAAPQEQVAEIHSDAINSIEAELKDEMGIASYLPEKEVASVKNALVIRPEGDKFVIAGNVEGLKNAKAPAELINVFKNPSYFPAIDNTSGEARSVPMTQDQIRITANMLKNEIRKVATALYKPDIGGTVA